METKQNKGVALVYYRVSSHQQAKKVSPEFQKQECLKLVRQEGFEVNENYDIYFDDESAFVGKKSNRDGFDSMTARWKSDDNVRAVVIYDLSRLFRDVRGYLNYKHDMELLNIELISATESSVRDTSPGGRLPATIIAAVNQYNSEQYGAKIKENMRYKAESGVYPGKAPFGYKNVRDGVGSDKDRRWIETNQNEAPWVQKAFLLYSSGNYTLRSLADKLTVEGFPVRYGKSLRISVLSRLLTDKIYIGWIEWGSVSNPNGTHEKLVTPDLYEKVRLVLAAHNHEGNRKRKHYFLLRGLGWCGCGCGSRMQAGYATNRYGTKYAHYFSDKKVHGRPVECHEHCVSVADLELQFSGLFKKLELTPEAKDKLRQKIEKSFGARQKAYENARRGLLLSIDNVKQDQKKAFLEYAKGKTPSDIYEMAKAELEAQEKDFNKKLANLEGNMAMIMRALEISVELTQDIYKAYLKAPEQVRSVLAQAFFKRIEVKDKIISRADLRAPLDFVLYKKLKNTEVFNLANYGGDGRNWTAVRNLAQWTST